MITIESEPGLEPPDLSAPTLTRFLNRARAAIGLRGAVDVLLTTDRTLRQLNRSFRGKDQPTDVLSFPAPPAFAKKHAGDLAISIETAARQAKAFAHPTQDEVKILILHGLLHLAGEDHETDKGEMATREATLRRELHLPSTLIERTPLTTTNKHITTTQRPSKTTKKPSIKSKKRLSVAKKSPTRGGK
jgi:probable rRNA maturation factor